MSKKILLLGAGRSSGALIDYLLEHAAQDELHLAVADQSIEHIREKLHGNTAATAVVLNAADAYQTSDLVKENDIVISLLPPAMHDTVAALCLQHKKHLLTASYLTEFMKKSASEVSANGLLFMGELGLDPGIDHMSAMQIIQRLRDAGAKIESFKSSTGGLVAPEHDTNPWRYKITWNPRNVVLAGQGTARYREKGKIKFIPYSRLFTQVESVTLDGYGEFESYANRDSLQYIDLYGLHDVGTVLRATLRREGYVKAWNVLLQLGLTDDSYVIDFASGATWHDWVEAYLPEGRGPLPKRISKTLNLKQGKKVNVLEKLEWLGLFDKTPIPLQHATPAQLLQHLLEQKWKMGPHDKDMVVMVHEFVYKRKGAPREKLVSSLVVKGDNAEHTAMAKTVGLPLGIFARMLAQEHTALRGVHIPVMRDVYEPVLKELEQRGVVFNEAAKKA